MSPDASSVSAVVLAETVTRAFHLGEPVAGPVWEMEEEIRRLADDILIPCFACLDLNDYGVSLFIPGEQVYETGSAKLTTCTSGVVAGCAPGSFWVPRRLPEALTEQPKRIQGGMRAQTITR